MIAFILAIILILLAIVALALEKTYFNLPAKELKRLAVLGDPLSKTLYRAEAYGSELKLLLWLIAGLSAAGGFVLLARLAPAYLGFLVVVISLWLAFVWIPRSRLTNAGVKLAVICTPTLVQVLRIFHPVAVFMASYSGRYVADPHTGLYETDDVLELIERQKGQPDNRIGQRELELMRNVLQFGDHHVRDLVIPKRKVKALNLDDNIGPVLLDELHASGHVRFPVYESKSTNIVGTFSIDHLKDITTQGKIKDYYERRVAYVHEEDNLQAGLRAFYETQQPLLVVVNGFNEYVGIITLHDTLHRLLGTDDGQTAESHSDRKAVAARYTHPDDPLPEPKLEENVIENSSEVVE
ncbi:MAG: CBS domain-containing protein [Candidatus Saccharimonadales bacterium]